MQLPLRDEYMQELRNTMSEERLYKPDCCRNFLILSLLKKSLSLTAVLVFCFYYRQHSFAVFEKQGSAQNTFTHIFHKPDQNQRNQATSVALTLFSKKVQQSIFMIFSQSTCFHIWNNQLCFTMN
jgi:hypothetical protein